MRHTPMVTVSFSNGEFIETSNPLRIGGMVCEVIRVELQELLCKSFKKKLEVTQGSFDALLRDEYRSVYPSFVYHVSDTGLKLVAYGELHELSCATGKDGFIENIVVDPDFQGRKLGLLVVQKLLVAAWHMDMVSVQLTSAPYRVAARALYEKIGFKKRTTDVFEYTFE